MAVREDAATILRLIRELADYENLLDQVRASEADILRDGFGDPPRFECLLAEQGGVAVGFALFFHNYSTFLGKPGIYLEDLFVRPEFRGKGIGRSLLEQLVRLGRERGCGRLEWWVLDWNEAAIRFYESLGAEAMSDWTVYRLTLD